MSRMWDEAATSARDSATGKYRSRGAVAISTGACSLERAWERREVLAVDRIWAGSAA